MNLWREQKALISMIVSLLRKWEQWHWMSVTIGLRTERASSIDLFLITCLAQFCRDWVKLLDRMAGLSSLSYLRQWSKLMDFTQAQEKIARDTHRFRVVVCGRKFGKTTLTSLELITRAIKDDQKRIIYIAPTLGDARRLMWDRLRNSFKSAVVKENDTRLEMRVKTTKDGESDIFLGSWELVNNYRGDEFDFIVFDEVQEYRNFWTGWQEAMRPTLTPRAGGALFTGTPKGVNHLYDLYNLEYKDRFQVIQVHYLRESLHSRRWDWESKAWTSW